LDLLNNLSLGGSGGLGGLVVSFPKGALFFLGSESGSSSGFLSLLLLKESLLRGEFRFSLFEVGSSGGMSGSEHISGSLEVVNETEESSSGGLFVGGVLNEGSLEGLEETLHFVDDDSELVTINSRSNLHEGSNWVRFTNLSQLSESGGSRLRTKRLKSWDNHLKGFNSLFSFGRSDLEGSSITSSIGSDLSIMSSN